MEPNQFDRISQFFATRRLSRRHALRHTGTGLAVAGLAAAGLRSADAQDATPAAGGTKGENDPTFLFVQSFQSGSLSPKDGADGAFTLTLDQGLGQTIFFSDRPDRVVGSAPTATFLAQFPFGEDNPPNAALVVETAPGETDIVVVELTSPQYDEASRTATYEARVLADYQELGTIFQEEPKGADEVPAQFGAASLFIDDCADANPLECLADCGTVAGDLGLHGMCWSWSAFRCLPCGDGFDGTAATCNQKYPSVCKGQCFTDQAECML